MTKFFRDADSFRFVNDKAVDIYDELPPGNYVIKQDPRTMELFLDMVDSFVAPPKLYGDTQKTADRILNTFYARPAGTGVLLVGEKGSGKTLLARTVCMAAALGGMPTIIVNAPWSGDPFFQFISSIHQPCIILFDEFEKVYANSDGGVRNQSNQNSILTLLDGVFSSKKLFLMTCNDELAINRNMINRPGRIFYSKEYGGLEENFIREYCEDNLEDKTHIDAVVRAASVFSQFNFDMLKALIEEMNRYKETPAESLVMLNISPVHDFADYDVDFVPASGVTLAKGNVHPSNVRNPLGQKNGIEIIYHIPDSNEHRVKAPSLFDDDNDERDSTRRAAMFYPADVVSADREKIVLRNKDGDILNLTKEKFGAYNWRAL